MNETVLSRAANPATLLATALGRFQGREFAGYGITRGAVVVLSGKRSGEVAGRGAVHADAFDAGDLEGIYEARVFAEDLDLRWRRDPAGSGAGTEVWIWEGEGEAPIHGRAEWVRQERIEVVETVDNHYLLWGHIDDERADPINGWLTVSDARIGQLELPWRSGNGVRGDIDRIGDLGRRVRVATRQYIAVAPGEAGEKHGNLAVVDERWVALESYAPTEWAKNETRSCGDE